MPAERPTRTGRTGGRGCLKARQPRVRSLSRIHCKYVQLILVLHKIEATSRARLPVWPARAPAYTYTYASGNAHESAALHTNFFYGQLLKTLKSTRGRAQEIWTGGCRGVLRSCANKTIFKGGKRFPNHQLTSLSRTRTVGNRRLWIYSWETDAVIDREPSKLSKAPTPFFGSRRGNARAAKLSKAALDQRSRARIFDRPALERRATSVALSSSSDQSVPDES